MSAWDTWKISSMFWFSMYLGTVQFLYAYGKGPFIGLATYRIIHCCSRFSPFDSYCGCLNPQSLRNGFVTPADTSVNFLSHFQNFLSWHNALLVGTIYPTSDCWKDSAELMFSFSKRGRLSDFNYHLHLISWLITFPHKASWFWVSFIIKSRNFS